MNYSERVNARLSTAKPRGRNAKEPVRSIFAGRMNHAGTAVGTVTRINKGDWVYPRMRSRIAAKCGDPAKYASVPYESAVEAASRCHLRGWGLRRHREAATPQRWTPGDSVL